jgi:hypothetical protein
LRDQVHFHPDETMTAALSGNRSATAAKAGIGFGTALAIAISWSANKSILWAIVHGLLSWIYVIYYAIRYS